MHILEFSILRKYWLLFVASLILSACTIYEPTHTTGNLLSKDQIAKLQVGMSKTVVQQTLGSPLLQDAFHTNRWDYVYRQSVGDKLLTQNTFTVMFDEQGKLLKWTGFDPSTVAAAPASISLPVVKPIEPAITDSGLSKAAVASPIEPAPVQADASAKVNPTKPVSAAITTPPLQVIAPAPTANNTAPPSTVATASKEQNTPNKDSTDLTSQNSSQLFAALDQWLMAWRSADLQTYINSYTPQFKGRFANRNQWIADRKKKIVGRKITTLELSQMKVQMTGPNSARFYFFQNYVSPEFTEKGEKTLLFEKVDGKWLITGEIFNKGA